MNDYSLIESFQEGDEFAFIGLYNRFKNPVFGFCLKMLGDREQAEDVMQETFLRVYENRDRLMKTSSFKSWLFTIARNQCLNTIRKSGRTVAMYPSVRNTLVAQDTPVTRMEKSEQVEFVSGLLARLKPEYREVIVLREYQNLSYQEIAAATRSSLSAVKSRLFKARRKLEEMLQEAEPPPGDATPAGTKPNRETVSYERGAKRE
ncbi:MAG: RNA polymerase sigma factor [Rhodothermales bacterium]|nr:RNA polymerase sigma factor [Rhodothermales bacterium]